MLKVYQCVDQFFCSKGLHPTSSWLQITTQGSASSTQGGFVRQNRYHERHLLVYAGVATYNIVPSLLSKPLLVIALEPSTQGD
jgi:hypothetical protein